MARTYRKAAILFSESNRHFTKASHKKQRRITRDIERMDEYSYSNKCTSMNPRMSPKEFSCASQKMMVYKHDDINISLKTFNLLPRHLRNICNSNANNYSFQMDSYFDYKNEMNHRTE
uniref:Uncharacterized protein n=1 Tax=Clandestinovirus TaxID=2831644 RepID=A0A8F8KTD9_9VIRU|nr:hypothetical protein KOM_12_63 [Clandestinovirus]